MYVGVAVLGFWDSVAREEAFLPSPLELGCSSLCLVGQAGTDQKVSAMLSTVNKDHSTPAGQCLFCPTFACSCKWFIKNYSVFLFPFCTSNGQIFSLVILCWTPCIRLHCFVCVQWWSLTTVLEVVRGVKLGNSAHAVVILHKNQVSMCTTCQNTTRKCAWVFFLPHFVEGETET